MKPERIQEKDRKKRPAGWSERATMRRVFDFGSLDDLIDFAQRLKGARVDGSLEVTISGNELEVTLIGGKKGFGDQDMDLARDLNKAFKARRGTGK